MQPVDPNALIVRELREQFEKLARDLAPEAEPATVYKLDAEEQKHDHS